jgi:cobalt-zinc-cadmium efflux system membrane fusion protein
MPESSPPKPSSPASPSPASREHGGRGLSPRRQWFLVLGLALVVGAALGFGWLRGHVWATDVEHKGDTAAQTASPGTFRPTSAQLANLKIAPVASATFRTEQVTDGKIALNGDKTTPVFSPYSGRVTKVLAHLGDNVKQGQPLLAIDATEFVQGQNDLVVAVNLVKTAHAQVTLAQTNEQRKHALFDAKGGSLQDWQQSQSDLIAAQNALRSADTALALVRNRLRILGKSDTEISSLENPEKMNAGAFVLAPIGGTVTDRQVGLGQYIQSGAANPVYAIGDLSTLWLIGNVREADAPLMRRGQAVEVRILALPGRVFKARLTYVAPSVDPASRRLAVRAEVENPTGVLKPEMFASFSIITGSESAAPGVPESAVVYEGDTARVWVVDQNDMLALRQIRTGRTSHGVVEVVAGLTPGEKVVTSGTLFIDRAGRGD